MNAPDAQYANPPTAAGWQARLALEFSADARRTIMESMRHFGPLRVQRPFYPEGDSKVCHIYLLHPPGGVVGGDRLDIEIDVKTQARVLLTTPGSAKFYRSSGAMAKVHQTLRVDEGASLEWFAQENILFPGARVHSRTQVQLQGRAVFMGWDISCLGRPTNAERFIRGRLDTAFEIYRDDQPLLLDRLRVRNAQALDGAAGLRGYPMSALFVATPCDTAHLAQARAVLAQQPCDEPIGLTLVDGVLVLRALGIKTERLQARMIPVWQSLREALLKRPAVIPRIWAT